MTNEALEYAKALATYRKALGRLKRAKTALAVSQAKPPPRGLSLAQIDALFPPSTALLTLRATINRRRP